MDSVVKFTSQLSRFESSPLWGWHIEIPKELALPFVNGQDKRVICTIDGHLSLHSALMQNKDLWYILLNQANVKIINKPLGADIDIQLQKDNSKYGMPMAEEFREVLDQYPEADEYFHALTPGKQRNMLYLVNQVKNVDGRIRKSLVIADHLTANQGKIVPKLLLEALKENK